MKVSNNPCSDMDKTMCLRNNHPVSWSDDLRQPARRKNGPRYAGMKMGVGPSEC